MKVVRLQRVINIAEKSSCTNQEKTMITQKLRTEKKSNQFNSVIKRTLKVIIFAASTSNFIADSFKKWISGGCKLFSNKKHVINSHVVTELCCSITRKGFIQSLHRLQWLHSWFFQPCSMFNSWLSRFSMNLQYIQYQESSNCLSEFVENVCGEKMEKSFY